MANNERYSNRNPETKKVDRKDPTWGIYVGEVINTKDLSRTGRIQVFISALSKDKESTGGRFDCIWTSPFAGGTDPAALGEKIESYEQTQKSYGMWMVPPDIGNLVLVAFGDGNLKFPYILGCLFPDKYNYMVPGMASGKSYSDPNLSVPVAEKNKRDERTTHQDAIRPIHIDLAENIVKQGLINDPIRGAGSASARRESPSEVFGILTPGPRDPKNFNNRLAGHQFIMDDRYGSRMIRLRSAGAQQILMDDTTGIIYIINKSGKTWIELDNGTINLYADASINMRTRGNFNLRADLDVNIEAGQNVNIKAAGDNVGGKDYKGILKGAAVGLPLGSGGAVNIESAGPINQFAMTTFNATSAVSDIQFSAAGALRATSGVTGLSLNTMGPFTISSLMPSSISTTKLDVVGGSAMIVNAGMIHLNGIPAVAIPPMPAIPAPRIGTSTQEDQPYEQPVFNSDNAKEGKPSIPLQGKRPGTKNKIDTIVPILITAEPYVGHAGKPPDPAQDDPTKVGADPGAKDTTKPGESPTNSNKPADVQTPGGSQAGVGYKSAGGGTSAAGGATGSSTGSQAGAAGSNSAEANLKAANAALERAVNSIPTYAQIQNAYNNFMAAAEKKLLEITNLNNVVKAIETAIPPIRFPITNAIQEKIVGVQKQLSEMEARLKQFGIDKLGLPQDLLKGELGKMKGLIDQAQKLATSGADFANRLKDLGLSVTRDGPSLIYTDAMGNKIIDISNGIGPIGTSLALTSDLNASYESVKSMIKVPLNDNQTAAISSFVNSIGPENFANSDVLAALNEGKYSEIPRLMKAWSLGADISGAGTEGSLVYRDDLEARRIYEGEVFQTPDEVNITPPSNAQPGDIGFLRLAEHISNLRQEYIRQKLNEFGFS